jgi:hypothetical protein
MAVTSLHELLERLVACELSPARRYRCLVLQADRIDLIGRLCDCLPSAFGTSGNAPAFLGWEGFFDAVGALSSDEVRGAVLAAGKDAPVVLAGPLHYVDFWTGGVQEGFWTFLSLYSLGPGVVVVDIPRTEGVEGPFVARGTIPGTEIRYLRPRLVVTEETLL